MAGNIGKMALLRKPILSLRSLKQSHGCNKVIKMSIHLSKQECCTSKQSNAPDEIEKFGSLSSEWWNQSGDFVVLKAMNKLRVPLIRDALLKDKEKPILKPLSSFRILDVGCGGGLLSEPLARLGAQVVGIDASEESIIASTAHSEIDINVKRNVKYSCSTVEELIDDYREFFDAVVASEVIEHVNNQSLFVRNCTELLKPGGHFFATTINRSLLSLLSAKFAAEYLLRIVPAGVHDWNKFVTTHEFTDMLRENGMEMISFYGMTYNPLLKKWAWINSTAVNYACHAIKPQIQ